MFFDRKENQKSTCGQLMSRADLKTYQSVSLFLLIKRFKYPVCIGFIEKNTQKNVALPNIFKGLYLDSV